MHAVDDVGFGDACGPDIELETGPPEHESAEKGGGVMKKGDAFCKNFKCRLKFLWGHQCDERDGLPASRENGCGLAEKEEEGM